MHHQLAAFKSKSNDSLQCLGCFRFHLGFCRSRDSTGTHVRTEFVNVFHQRPSQNGLEYLQVHSQCFYDGRIRLGLVPPLLRYCSTVSIRSRRCKALLKPYPRRDIRPGRLSTDVTCAFGRLSLIALAHILKPPSTISLVAYG